MKDRMSQVLKVVIGIVALVDLIFVAFIFIFPSKPIELIDFNNKSQNIINSWANENNISVTYENEYSDTVEKGNLISTILKDGTIFKGQNITLVYSLGPDPKKEIELIDFNNKSKLEIEEWCLENKMFDYSFEYVYSNEIAENNYISLNTDAIKVKRSDLLVFTISSGSNPEYLSKVLVPDFKDYSVEEAKNWGKVNNVVVKVSYDASTNIEKDKLISQEVKADEYVETGDTLNLIYCAGLPIKAISLKNLEKTDVNKWLKDNDNRFTITYIEQYSNNIVKGKVISSSLKDDYVKDNQEVKVYISLGKPVLDNFVNKDIALLKQAISKLNDKGANLQLKLTTEINDNINKNIIISQDKNGSLNVNDTITVKYSLGKGTYVSSYIGKNINEISNNEITIKKVASSSYNKNKENGEIISQDIINQKVAVGSTITLTYNKGYYLKPFSSIYTEVNDAKTLKTKIENDLKSEGFTNYQVIIQNYVGEATSGTVYKQTQPGIYSKDVEIKIYIQP